MNTKLLLAATAALALRSAPSPPTPPPPAYVHRRGRRTCLAARRRHRPRRHGPQARRDAGLRRREARPDGGRFPARAAATSPGSSPRPSGRRAHVYAVYPPPRARRTDPAKPPPPPAVETLAADPGYANVKPVKVSPCPASPCRPRPTWSGPRRTTTTCTTSSSRTSTCRRSTRQMYNVPEAGRRLPRARPRQPSRRSLAITEHPASHRRRPS
jgi:hypothetical protein